MTDIICKLLRLVVFRLTIFTRILGQQQQLTNNGHNTLKESTVDKFILPFLIIAVVVVAAAAVGPASIYVSSLTLTRDRARTSLHL